MEFKKLITGAEWIDTDNYSIMDQYQEKQIACDDFVEQLAMLLNKSKNNNQDEN
ncbi:hypothetical protein [Paenibacillus senegalensis]|uniref:hypothetical protein n=1 Tax=Paenibacillus senegalensis TaxID=1465766 RepID=UPI0002EE735D|nr:hypothetical protein [Paenibacillus senegalensis]